MTKHQLPKLALYQAELRPDRRRFYRQTRPDRNGRGLTVAQAAPLYPRHAAAARLPRRPLEARHGPERARPGRLAVARRALRRRDRAAPGARWPSGRPRCWPCCPRPCRPCASSWPWCGRIWACRRPPTPPCADLAALAQEDFCVMQAGEDGAYALTAALLCAPAHWRLAEKLGRPLGEIHAPVPGFNARLGGPADRFFAEPRRSSGRSGGRTGRWSRAPTLFHPQPREPPARPHGRERRGEAVAAGRAADPAPPAGEPGRRLHHPHPGAAAGRGRGRACRRPRHGRPDPRDGARHGRLQGHARALREPLLAWLDAVA